MGVGLDHPDNDEPRLFACRKDPVGRVCGPFPGARVEVEHRIDDGSRPRLRIADEITHRVGRLVEERLDVWLWSCDHCRSSLESRSDRSGPCPTEILSASEPWPVSPRMLIQILDS